MKKILLFMFVIITVLCSVSPCFAFDSYVFDDAGLLTLSEQAELEGQITEVSERQDFDIVIVTANTLYGKSQVEFADDYYDENGRGYGENRDGILLLIDMESREYYISTCGYGITAFNDEAIEYLGENTAYYLSDGDYVGAFGEFVSICDDFVSQAKSGTPAFSVKTPKKRNWLKIIPVGLGVGLITAFIPVSVMKSKLKTANLASSASDYMVPGSLHLTANHDIYLYSTVSKVAKSNGGSGGTSTHSSSSGTTHGGGGGRF